MAFIFEWIFLKPTQPWPSSVHPSGRVAILGVPPASELSGPTNDRCASAAVLSAWLSCPNMPKSQQSTRRRNFVRIAKLLSTHEICETYDTLQYCHPFWSTQTHSSIDPCSSIFVSRQGTHHRCSPVGVDGSPKSVPTPSAQTPRPASTKSGCSDNALDASGFNSTQRSFNPYRSNRHVSKDSGSSIERPVALALLQTFFGWLLGHSCKPQSLSTIRVLDGIK